MIAYVQVEDEDAGEKSKDEWNVKGSGDDRQIVREPLNLGPLRPLLSSRT